MTLFPSMCHKLIQHPKLTGYHLCDYKMTSCLFGQLNHLMTHSAKRKANNCKKSVKQRSHCATVEVIELLKLRIFHLAIMLDENLEFGQRNIITS
jgi:hypothetical protein